VEVIPGAAVDASVQVISRSADDIGSGSNKNRVAELAK